MADKVVSLEFNVNTGDAVTEINKVTKATDAATKSTDNYEQQLKDLKKATDGAGFRELNSALKQYRDLALQAGEESPIGRQALTEAAEIKDRLRGVGEEISRTADGARNMQAALQLGGGIVAGFGAVQGVMALVGSESEDLQKTLVKLQAAQAALASISEIRSVLEKESFLVITANTIAEKARAAATALGTMATNAGIMSLRAFKIALAATGIGAIVVALGMAAEAMGLFGDSTDNATASADKLNKELDKQKSLTDDLNKSIDKYTEVSVLKAKIAGKSEEDITKLEIDAQTERIANLNKYKDQAFNTYTKIANSEKEAKDKARQALADADKAYDEAVAKRNIMQLERDLKVEEKRREAEKQAAEEAKKRREEEAANLKKWVEERRALEKRIAEEAAEDRAKVEKANKEKEENEIKLMQEGMLERARLFAEQADAELARRNREIEDEKLLQTTKVNLAMQGFQLINEIVALSGDQNAKAAKRAFEVNKAFQLAQAAMEGYRAVLKTYAETPGGPVLKGIAAGIAGAFAAVQIAKISKSEFNSAKFDKSTVPTGSAIGNGIVTTAPTTPTTQSTLLNQPQQQQVIKAVVVESDITKVQNRVQSIIETASI